VKTITAGSKLARLVGSFEIKSKDTQSRTFSGALSTSHLDLGDGFRKDIVWPGAFKAWLDAMSTEADPYTPLLDSHNGFSILNVYGHMLDAEEVLTGKTLVYDIAKGGGKLKVPEMLLSANWQVIDGPDGDRVLDRLRPGSVRKMSMGYERLEADEIELVEGPARNLRKVYVHEGSLVVFAMQPNALIDRGSVKMVQLLEKDPEELSEDERKDLRRLATRIGSLLRPAGKSGEPPAGDEPPAAAAPADPPPAAAEVTDPPPATPSPEADSQKGNTPEGPVYLYAEALQQRLLGLKLSRTKNQTQGGASC
jgi:hypothetical protein